MRTRWLELMRPLKVALTTAASGQGACTEISPPGGTWTGGGLARADTCVENM